MNFASLLRLGEAMMGDVVRLTNSDVVLAIEAVASAPIMGIEMRNAFETIEVFQPFTDEDLGFA